MPAQPSLGVSLWFYKHEASGPSQYSTVSIVNPANGAFRLPPETADIGWQQLAEVIDISNDGPDATVIDTKHLQSVAYFKTFKRGFRDPGTLTCRANFVDTQWGRYLYLFKDYVYSGLTCYQTDERIWEIRIPDDTCGGNSHRFSFSGFLKTTGLEVPEDDRITTSIEIKLTGPTILQLASGNTFLDGPSSGASMTPQPGTAIS